MRVIDFIKSKSDCMNETDFMRILNTLADEYGESIRHMHKRNNTHISEKALLAGFLLQDIQEAHAGAYRFSDNLLKSAFIKNLPKLYR